MIRVQTIPTLWDILSRLAITPAGPVPVPSPSIVNAPVIGVSPSTEAGISTGGLPVSMPPNQDPASPYFIGGNTGIVPPSLPQWRNAGGVVPSRVLSGEDGLYRPLPMVNKRFLPVNTGIVPPGWHVPGNTGPFPPRPEPRPMPGGFGTWKFGTTMQGLEVETIPHFFNREPGPGEMGFSIGGWHPFSGGIKGILTPIKQVQAVINKNIVAKIPGIGKGLAALDNKVFAALNKPLDKIASNINVRFAKDKKWAQDHRKALQIVAVICASVFLGPMVYAAFAAAGPAAAGAGAAAAAEGAAAGTALATGAELTAGLDALAASSAATSATLAAEATAINTAATITTAEATAAATTVAASGGYWAPIGKAALSAITKAGVSKAVSAGVKSLSKNKNPDPAQSLAFAPNIPASAPTHYVNNPNGDLSMGIPPLYLAAGAVGLALLLSRR